MKISTSFLQIQNNKEKIEELNKIADYMHYDIMDGKFTENSTLCFEEIKKNTINISKPKDIHLMVTDIYNYIDIYSKLNPEFLTFHLEISDTANIINYIKNMNIKVGLSISPDTDIKELIPYLDKIDLVLVMSVNPGQGGQTFIDVSNKIDYLYDYREKNNLNYLIEVDGGINNNNINKVSKADIAVVGSYITNSDNYETKLNKLKEKGFTLLELLGVIILLSVLAAIVTILVTNSIDQSKRKLCTAQEKNIIEATKTYLIDNPDGLPDGGSSFVLVSDLIDQGYLDEEFKNPMTKENYSSGTTVKITTVSEKSYIYDIVGLNNNEKCYEGTD